MIDFNEAPTDVVSSKQKTQKLITVLLFLLFLSLLAGYIYYGMNKAGVINQTQDLSPAPERELTPAERAAVLEELEAAQTVISPDDRADVLDELEATQSTSAAVPPSTREEILRELDKQ